MQNLEFTVAIGLLIFVIYLFVRISLKIRKGGGTMTTTVHGALDSFYNKEQKKAVEMVVNKQADKKMDQQSSAEPE